MCCEDVTKAENTTNDRCFMSGRKPRILSDLDIEKGFRMRLDGFSYRDIAKVLKVSERTARRRIRL